ncbi:MAG: 7-carboxy-7-deazaguanine synthase QueE [Cyanobacteriota bacterium]
MTEIKGNLTEIFSSVQGEGPYLGYRQLFLRFANCNLNCSYCDTNFKELDSVKIHTIDSQENLTSIDNPVDIETLFFYIKQLDKSTKIHHSISLTGGEPLLQIEFLKVFLAENFAKYKYKIYLETNGILFEELERIVKLVDIISMDIKIPSSTKNTTETWHEHKKFLEILVENKSSKIEYFTKAIITSDFTEEELYNIVWCIASSESNASLILQPEAKNPPSAEKLLYWQEKLLKHIDIVRIIPQTHKILTIP